MRLKNTFFKNNKRVVLSSFFFGSLGFKFCSNNKTKFYFIKSSINLMLEYFFDIMIKI
jgi:hypothetical protein